MTTYTMEISQIGLPAKVSNEIVSAIKSTEYKGPIKVSAIISNAEVIKSKCASQTTYILRNKLREIGVEERDIDCLCRKRGRQKEQEIQEPEGIIPEVKETINEYLNREEEIRDIVDEEGTLNKIIEISNAIAKKEREKQDLIKRLKKIVRDF